VGSRLWGSSDYWAESITNFSGTPSRMCRFIRMQERGYEMSKPRFPRESLCFGSIDCYFSVVLGEWFGFAAFAAGGCRCAEQVSWSGYLFERYLVQGESRSLSVLTGLFVLNVLSFHKEDVGLWSHAVVFPISPLRSCTKFIFALVPPPPSSGVMAI